MELLMRRTLRGLEPLDESAEALKKVKLNEVLRVTTQKVRNPKRHRLFWAFVGLVHHNLPDDLAEKYPTPECLVDTLKLLTGHSERYWHPKLGWCEKPASIAFHAMDDIAFGIFMDRCFEIVAKCLIPGIRRDDVRAELESITGIK